MSKQLTLPGFDGFTSSPGSEAGSLPCGSPGGPTTAKSGQDLAPASRSVARGKARGKRTSGTSGPSFDDSSENVDHPSFSENKCAVRQESCGSEESRACNECGMLKPLSEFYKASTSLGGYRTKCKTCCCRRERKAKKRKNPHQLKDAFIQYRRTNRAKALSVVARYRAKKKGVPFTLTETTIKELQRTIDIGCCELTGIPFNLDGGKTWDSPSLDRIDNAKGYEPENVRVVLYCVNVMANLWGPQKIIEISQAIVKQRQSTSADLQRRLENSLKSRLDTQSSLEYAMTWKHWDMQSGPPICALRARARRTSDSVCSGWHTPQAHDPSPRSPGQKLKHGTKHGCGDLNADAQLAGWPTAGATDHKGPSQPEGRRPVCDNDLPSTAALAGWPTPNSGANCETEAGVEKELARQTNGGGGRSKLQVVVHLAGWVTPQHRDSKGLSQNHCREDKPKDDCLPDQVTLTPGLIRASSPAGTGKSAVLEPAFSRWLQGYPEAWDRASPGYEAWQRMQDEIASGGSGDTATQ